MKNCKDEFPSNSFDIVTCMGNTLVHLGSASEISFFFKSIHGILRRGGFFIGQIINYDKVLNTGSFSFNEIEDPDFKFTRKYKLSNDGENVDFYGDLLIKNENKIHKNKISLFPATSGFIRESILEAGFREIEFYGGFDKRQFVEGSDTLIFKTLK